VWLGQINLWPNQHSKRKMKIKLLLSVLLISAFGIAKAGSFTAADGDFFLGFQASSGVGSTTNYVVDLGSIGLANTFGGTVKTLDLSADLSSIYGSGWASRNDLTYGIFGYYANNGVDNKGNSKKANTFFASADSASDPWAKSDYASLGGVVASASSVVAAAAADPSGTVANSAKMASTETYSWGNYSTSSGAFSFFGSSIETGIANSLNIYQLEPTPDDGSAPYYGSASLSSLGNLTVTTVPEPSSVALVGIAGLGAAFILYRRRKAQV
jgi:PEP-CTERM motif